MDLSRPSGWTGELERWLAPFLTALSRPEQRRWAPLYLKGLLLPGDELWLVGERRSGGERKYYLASHPAGTPLQTLAATIKARWVCEQAHQQMKEELGLDHFEGRSWAGLHHHALMVLIAFAFPQHLRLRRSGQRGKNLRHRSAAPTELARRPSRAARSARRRRPTAMSQMPRGHRPAQARMKVPK